MQARGNIFQLSNERNVNSDTIARDPWPELSQAKERLVRHLGASRPKVCGEEKRSEVGRGTLQFPMTTQDRSFFLEARPSPTPNPPRPTEAGFIDNGFAFVSHSCICCHILREVDPGYVWSNCGFSAHFCKNRGRK